VRNGPLAYGERIARERRAAGLSIPELAAAALIDVAKLRLFERGQCGLPLPDLQRLNEILEEMHEHGKVPGNGASKAEPVKVVQKSAAGAAAEQSDFGYSPTSRERTEQVNDAELELLFAVRTWGGNPSDLAAQIRLLPRFARAAE
jgi:transcriptional regulator with XRE-family HTH domain